MGGLGFATYVWLGRPLPWSPRGAGSPVAWMSLGPAGARMRPEGRGEVGVTSPGLLVGNRRGALSVLPPPTGARGDALSVPPDTPSL